MAEENVFRWAVAGILLIAITMSGYHRRKARRTTGVIARREESAGLIAGRIVLGLPILIAILAFVAAPSRLSWSYVDLPVWVRWAGVVLGIACIPLLYWVLTSLGSNISETVLTKRDHRLVEHGPYRTVRHPLYAVALLMLASLALIASSWLIAVLTAAVGLGIAVVVIPKEEAALTEKFGDEYRRYAARTGRLLPRVGG